VALIDTLLPKVKGNLILQHDEDDALLRGYISAAVDYAEGYQNKPQKYYHRRGAHMPPATEQAVIMLSSHFYESSDGSTGGFFADNTNAAAQVWMAVNRLLALGKEWIV